MSPGDKLCVWWRDCSSGRVPQENSVDKLSLEGGGKDRVLESQRGSRPSPEHCSLIENEVIPFGIENDRHARDRRREGLHFEGRATDPSSGDQRLDNIHLESNAVARIGAGAHPFGQDRDGEGAAPDILFDPWRGTW
jgi:hypothetical protein